MQQTQWILPHALLEHLCMVLLANAEMLSHNQLHIPVLLEALFLEQHVL